MRYKFRTSKGDIIRPFFNDLVTLEDEQAGMLGVMSWGCCDKHGYSTKYSNVVTDENGDAYFIFDKEKIFMKDYLALEPAKLVELLSDRNNELASEELIYTLMRYGIDSLHIMIRKEPSIVFEIGNQAIMVSAETPFTNKNSIDFVEYKFEEAGVFKLQNNYKIRVVPANADNVGTYAPENLYVKDLFQLISCDMDDYILKENKVA